MERIHADSSGVALRNASGSTTSGALPGISSSTIRNELFPESGMFAVLPCPPSFRRTMFGSTGIRPNSDQLLAKATMTAGDVIPVGHVMKYVDVTSTARFHMECYTPRYRLQANYVKLRHFREPTNGCLQPEDLTVSTSGHGSGLRADDSFDEEAPMAAEDCAKQQKSTNELKFSIANILGTASDKRKKSKTADPKPLSPSSHSCASPEPEVDIVTDPDQPRSADKESSGEEKGPDVLTSDSEHFSWLQCTRYKPPKLPRSKKKDGSKKRKLGRNPRVPFTQHQVTVLEQKFRQTHYLSSVDVAELSAALNLTETRVKIWFQNRRARERRDRENIQLLQGGNAISGSTSKPKTSPSDRLSPETGSTPMTSSRDRGQEVVSPAPVSLYSHRLQLANGVTPPIGLSGLAQLGGPQLPPGPWPGPFLPKPSVLAQFPGSHRNSAFTPVTYFSYS